MADEPSLYQRLDRGLTSIFGPINRGLRRVVPEMSPADSIMMALSTIRPGAGLLPRLLPNQPRWPPSANDLTLQMLQARANPQGVLEASRTGRARGAPFRGQTFNPTMERLNRPVDAIEGIRVLTPANRTAEQTHNLAILRQLLGE